ncbi:MAG: DNA polymerase III subunit gamma/tau [Candidatus Zixiibacteriota bacterium]|nr:MAG: DNA polymerase III subunit gamma/tau [candidate division Zixibacteria bacterium]
MSYLALARKYRPGDFENIISQHHITTTLKNAVKLGRISHAYLFCGPRGTGKTTTARVLSKALNCEKGPIPEPCGECTVCIEIARCSSPDVFEIDAASNRGIDDIRELRENVRYAPVGGRYKIYIIDEVHRLTKEAFDALLKTLEEPPAHVIFIFATTEPQALPPTILSRTQRYDFKRIPVSSLAEAINSIAQKEGLIIDPDAALMIAKKADGSLRDAISLLDQLSSFSDSKIDIAGAAEILGIVKTEFLFNVTLALTAHDTSKALSLFGDFVKSGGDSQELAEALTGYVRTLLLIKNGVEDFTILEMEKNEIEQAKEILDDIESVDLLRFFTILADYKQTVKSGQDPRFSFEAALVKLSTMDRAVTLEDLLKNHRPDSGNYNPPSAPAGPIFKERNERKNTKPYNSGFNHGFAPAREYASPVERKNPVEPLKYQGDLSIDIISENWDDFCSFISQEDKAIFAHLSLSMPSQFENDILKIGMDDSHKFQFEQLSKIGNKKSLEKHLKKFFSKEMKLNIIQGPNEGRKSGDLPGNLNPEKLFNGSPGLKKLFDLMDGEILTQ